MLKKIEEIIKEYVRPQLLEHEGDVEIVEWNDGILKVRLLGKCSGCPSASVTTEELIAKEIKERIPEVLEVVLVSGVSQGLIDLANQMLHDSQKRRKV